MGKFDTWVNATEAFFEVKGRIIGVVVVGAETRADVLTWSDAAEDVGELLL